VGNGKDDTENNEDRVLRKLQKKYHTDDGRPSLKKKTQKTGQKH
jgi:hypothetical protein